MISRSQSSVDLLRAIETITETEKLHRKKEKETSLIALTRKTSERATLGQKMAQGTERFQRRAAVFLKHNGLLLAGIGVFAASVVATRKYWRSR
jgi:hypothetical protein